MAEHSTTFSHESADERQHDVEGRSGGGCHEHVALLDGWQLLDVANKADGTFVDARAHAKALQLRLRRRGRRLMDVEKQAHDEPGDALQASGGWWEPFGRRGRRRLESEVRRRRGDRRLAPPARSLG